MKSIVNVLFLIMFVIGCGSHTATAANKTKLVWTAPTTNVDGTPCTDLAGFRVYCGGKSATYTIIKDVGNVLETLILGVVSKDGVYFCAVTAYDITGNESAFSNEVSFTIDYTKPSPPGPVTPNNTEFGELRIEE